MILHHTCLCLPALSRWVPLSKTLSEFEMLVVTMGRQASHARRPDAQCYYAAGLIETGLNVLTAEGRLLELIPVPGVRPLFGAFDAN